MLRTLATIYLVLSILSAIGVALGFFGGDMLFNLMAAFGVLFSALLMYAVLSAIEDMRDATVATQGTVEDIRHLLRHPPQPKT